jgi:hypothetical protein
MWDITKFYQRGNTEMTEGITVNFTHRPWYSSIFEWVNILISKPQVSSLTLIQSIVLDNGMVHSWILIWVLLSLHKIIISIFLCLILEPLMHVALRNGINHTDWITYVWAMLKRMSVTNWIQASKKITTKFKIQRAIV